MSGNNTTASDGSIRLSLLSKEGELTAALEHTRESRLAALAKSKSRLSSLLFNLRTLCLLLHTSLLAIHVGLLFIWKFELEHNVVFELGQASNFASTAITVTLQSFGTVYSTLMVYTTQQLVMRRQIHHPTTLTAVHDNSNAWSGIGSGLLTLWRNVCLPVSVRATILAVMYLGAIAVLHITTPALLSVQSFNASFPVNLTLSGLPDYRLASPIISQSLIPVVQALPKTSTVGLRNGTLYEVPSESPVPGTFAVTATYFNMSCGSSSNITNDLDAYRTFSNDFKKSGCMWNKNHRFCDISPNALLILNPFDEYRSGPKWDDLNLVAICLQEYKFTVISSVIFADSDGGVGSVIPLDPPIKYNQPFEHGTSVVSELQVMRCQLALNHFDAAIEAQTKLPVSGAITTSKSHSLWRQSSRAGAQNVTQSDIPGFVDFSLISSWDTQLSGNGLLRSQINTLDYAWIASSEDCWYAPSQQCAGAVFTQMEISLMMTLGLRPDFIKLPYVSRQNSTLHDLENAFSQVIAALFWSDLNIPQGDPEYPVVIGNTTQPITRLVEVALLSPASRLEISKAAVCSAIILYESNSRNAIIKLLAGLITTAVLLLLSLPLCFQPKSTVAGQPDSLDVLSLLWLLRGQPDVYEIMSDVDDPTVDNLRAAGITDISWTGEGESSREQAARQMLPMS